jgi:hypothetical protein
LARAWSPEGNMLFSFLFVWLSVCFAVGQSQQDSEQPQGELPHLVDDIQYLIRVGTFDRGNDVINNDYATRGFALDAKEKDRFVVTAASITFFVTSKSSLILDLQLPVVLVHPLDGDAGVSVNIGSFAANQVHSKIPNTKSLDPSLEINLEFICTRESESLIQVSLRVMDLVSKAQSLKQFSVQFVKRCGGGGAPLDGPLLPGFFVGTQPSTSDVVVDGRPTPAFDLTRFGEQTPGLVLDEGTRKVLSPNDL